MWKKPSAWAHLKQTMWPEGNGFLSEVDCAPSLVVLPRPSRAERFLIYTRALDTLRVVFLPAGLRLRFFAPSRSNWSRLRRSLQQTEGSLTSTRCILLVRGLASSRTVPGLECVASAVLPGRAAAKNLIHFKNASSLTLSKQARKSCAVSPRFDLNQVRSWRERSEWKKTKKQMTLTVLHMSIQTNCRPDTPETSSCCKSVSWEYKLFKGFWKFSVFD